MTFKLALVDLLPERSNGRDVLLVEELLEHVFLAYHFSLEYLDLSFELRILTLELIALNFELQSIFIEPLLLSIDPLRPQLVDVNLRAVANHP